MKYTNIIRGIRLDIENSLSAYKKKIPLKEFKNELDIAYLKYLNNVLLNSDDFLKLYSDIKKKRIKKKYYFEDYEIYLFSKTFCKKNNIKTKIFLFKFKFINFITFKFIKLIYLFFSSKIKINKFGKYKNLFYFENLSNQNEINFSKKIKLKCKNIDKYYLLNSGSIKFSEFFKILSIKYIRLTELNFKYLLYKNSLSYIKPELIFFLEGDSPDQEIISRLSKKLNFYTCCFQWGSITNIDLKYGFKNMSHNFFFCWGNYYLKIFKKYNKKVKFYVTGNPMIKDILIKNKIVFLMHPKTLFIDKKEENNFLELIKIISEKYKNKILVRSHPYSDVKFYFENVVTHNSKEKTLIKTLEEAFCSISIRSSSLIEAARMGIIPVIFSSDRRNINKAFYLFEKVNSTKLFLQNPKEVINLIDILIKNKKSKLKLSKKIKNKSTKLINIIGSKSEIKINKQIDLLKRMIRKI